MDIDTSKLVNFVLLSTKDEYDNLPLVQKQSNYIFFIEDTGEIYKGTLPYGNNVFIVNTLPIEPLNHRIYIHDNKIKIYENYQWKVIDLNPDVYSSIDTENPSEERIPSEKAVKDFVDNMMKRISNAIFSSMQEAFDHASNVQESTPGQIISVYYQNEYRPYIITSNRGLEPLTGSIAMNVDVEDTRSVSMSMNKNGIISANVEVSSEVGNLISIKDDGIHASLKISSEEGNTLEMKDDGLYTNPQLSLSDDPDNMIQIKDGKLFISKQDVSSDSNVPIEIV